MSQYERLCDNVLHKKIGAANTYIFKIVVCIIIAVIVNEASFAMDLKFRLFFERDTDLSYYIKGKPNYDTVSVGEVIGLSAGIGLAFVAISTAMLNIRPSTGKTENTGISRLQHFLLYALALIFALLAENTAVSIMKVACARPRPSAFYICNYKGYRDAVDSGDFTDYDNATVIGAAADVKYVYSVIHFHGRKHFQLCMLLSIFEYIVTFYIIFYSFVRIKVLSREAGHLQ